MILPGSVPLRKPRPVLPILHRLIVTEVVKTFLGVFAILLFIVVSHQFIGILDKAISGEIATQLVLKLLWLKSLSVAIVILPTVLFMAILVVLGRMHRDQEITAMAAAGASYWHCYRVLSWLVLPMTIAAAILAFDVLRWTATEIEKIRLQGLKEYDLKGIRPGRFQEFNRGELVFYAERIEPDGTLERVFTQRSNADHLSVITAQTGRFQQADNGDQFIVLGTGERVDGLPGRRDFSRLQFDHATIQIRRSEMFEARAQKQQTPAIELWHSGEPNDFAELHRRIAVPGGVLVLSLLAVPMARSAPRSGFYANIVMAFLIYVTYENLQRVTQGLMIKAVLPYPLAFTWVYMLLVAVTLLLLWKQGAFRRGDGSR